MKNTSFLLFKKTLKKLKCPKSFYGGDEPNRTLGQFIISSQALRSTIYKIII